MERLTILTIPNPILRKKSKPIKEITSEVKALAEEMLELLGREHYDERPVSIAAPQVGELLRMFVYLKNPYSVLVAPFSPDDAALVVINPELVYAKGDVTLSETCLSLPGKSFQVKRHKLVKLRGLDLTGRLRSFKGRAFMAQLLEHELDHLDGILIDELGIIDLH